jgi:hypothetical protein
MLLSWQGGLPTLGKTNRCIKRLRKFQRNPDYAKRPQVRRIAGLACPKDRENAPCTRITLHAYRSPNYSRVGIFFTILWRGWAKKFRAGRVPPRRPPSARLKLRAPACAPVSRARAFWRLPDLTESQRRFARHARKRGKRGKRRLGDFLIHLGAFLHGLQFPIGATSSLRALNVRQSATAPPAPLPPRALSGYYEV